MDVEMNRQKNAPIPFVPTPHPGSDVIGRITPASVYALIDQTLGAWGQRPLYKANVQSFVTLREVPPSRRKRPAG